MKERQEEERQTWHGRSEAMNAFIDSAEPVGPGAAEATPMDTLASTNTTTYRDKTNADVVSDPGLTFPTLQLLSWSTHGHENLTPLPV